jgi:hypothetical protein
MNFILDLYFNLFNYIAKRYTSQFYKNLKFDKNESFLVHFFRSRSLSSNSLLQKWASYSEANSCSVIIQKKML